MIAELRTFVAIARYGTFSRAADRVGLTQAAVSGQIKRLEDHLGFELFDRTARSAVLNADGRRTLPRAQAILGLVDVLGDPETDATTGTLRVGAIASVHSTLLARAIGAFRQRYPNVGVHVVPGLSLHLIDQVDSGEMDLAVLIRPPFELPPELAWHSLSRQPYVLLVHDGCQGDDWRDVLQREPFIRYHRLSFGGRLVSRFLRKLPFEVSPGVEVPLRAMITMVQNRIGVALVPVSEAQFPLPEGLRALHLDDDMLFRDVGFIQSRLTNPEPPASYLAECLTNSVETKQDIFSD